MQIGTTKNRTDKNAPVSLGWHAAPHQAKITLSLTHHAPAKGQLSLKTPQVHFLIDRRLCWVVKDWIEGNQTDHFCSFLQGIWLKLHI